MKPDDENIIAVRTFINEFEAERAKGILKEEGIESFVSSDNVGGMEPPLQLVLGIKLFVLERDFTRAKEILDAYDSFIVEEEN